jgi:DNA-binding LytR/AlgR family response regulator
MTTAIIADDEPFALASLVDALATVWPELQVVAQASDGPEAYTAIQKHQPDLAFLDIRMPGMTGLQVADAIGGRIRVVFVTAHDSYAVSAFEKGAVDYVLKPIELARLATVTQRLRERISVHEEVDVKSLLSTLEQVQHQLTPAATKLEWIKASHGTQVRLIHVDDVHYFESDTKYTRVVTADSDALIRIPLRQLIEQLDNRWFWQVRRSAVVNVRQVSAVTRQDDVMEISLKNRPERIKVSTHYQALFRNM